jgi:hypothetical protein
MPTNKISPLLQATKFNDTLRNTKFTNCFYRQDGWVHNWGNPSENSNKRASP